MVLDILNGGLTMLALTVVLLSFTARVFFSVVKKMFFEIFYLCISDESEISE